MTENEPLNPYTLSSFGFSYRRNAKGDVIYYKDDFELLYDMKTHSLLEENSSPANGSDQSTKINTRSELLQAYKAKTGKSLE